MRFFDLFLRRAGVERTEAVSRRRGTSRLTVVCPRDSLDSLRRQICLDFSAAGLSVSQFQVDAASKAGSAQAGGAQADMAQADMAQADMAQACITVDCPPELRAELMSQARRLSAHPAVRHVHFGASAAAGAATGAKAGASAAAAESSAVTA